MLSLGGLRGLSADAARALATHAAGLSLAGLAEIDPTVAAALARHPGQRLPVDPRPEDGYG